MNRPQLLIDLGNTRLKWAVLAPDGALKAGAAIAHTEDGFGELAPLLEAGAECAAAWVSSTALSLSDALLLTLRQRLGLPTQLFRSPKEAHGIRSAYDHPETLGTDRFLAMVGARTVVDGAFLVADAGTALTVDMVDSEGQHLGGLIVPGPVLMREALHRGTAGIRTGEVVRLREFARSTDDAVWSGGCLACVALIEHAHRHGVLGVGEHVDLLLAGGAMPALAPHLSLPHRTVDDLVLRGLAVWAEQQA
ncbi:MAG: type III pantothenate kinase [Lysobacterales bacterium]